MPRGILPRIVSDREEGGSDFTPRRAAQDSLSSDWIEQDLFSWNTS
jgi:hypothetical protein